jgi:hypothetical protein
LTTVAFYASLMLTAAIELHLAWKDWGIGSPPSVSPVSLFAGGMAGGFLVIGGALFLAGPKTRLGSLTRRALRWSVLGGILAPMGWALGPWVASGHPGPAAPIAPFGNTPNNQYALYVVWQTGIAFALGIALRGNRAISSSEELKLT